MAEKVYQLLGLARRAGHVESGDAAVRSVIARKKAFLLLIADDSAQRTKKAFEELSISAGIPLYSFGLKTDLGRSMGRPHRSVVAITERKLARAVVRALEGGGV